eukprot:m.18938 g.18938  ORF g.18938 m.18938 type:complete len:147 (+) comp10867_c0_seq1:152-592(+)
MAAQQFDDGMVVEHASLSTSGGSLIQPKPSSSVPSANGGSSAYSISPYVEASTAVQVHDKDAARLSVISNGSGFGALQAALRQMANGDTDTPVASSPSRPSKAAPTPTLIPLEEASSQMHNVTLEESEDIEIRTLHRRRPFWMWCA